MKKLLFSLAAAALLASPVAFAGPQRAGQWQTTIEIEMPGMQMKIPPQTFTRCVTKEEAEHPAPPKNPRETDCTISDYKIDSGSVSWKVSCPKTNTTGEGKMTFHGDSFEGFSHIKTADHDVTTKMSGKRLGDCK